MTHTRVQLHVPSPPQRKAYTIFFEQPYGHSSTTTFLTWPLEFPNEVFTVKTTEPQRVVALSLPLCSTMVLQLHDVIVIFSYDLFCKRMRAYSFPIVYACMCACMCVHACVHACMCVHVRLKCMCACMCVHACVYACNTSSACVQHQHRCR